MAGKCNFKSQSSLPVKTFQDILSSIQNEEMMAKQGSIVALAEFMWGQHRSLCGNNQWKKDIVNNAMRNNKPPLMFQSGTNNYGMIWHQLTKKKNKMNEQILLQMKKSLKHYLRIRNPSIDKRGCAETERKIEFSGGVAYLVRDVQHRRQGQHDLEEKMNSLIAEYGMDEVCDWIRKCKKKKEKTEIKNGTMMKTCAKIIQPKVRKKRYKLI